MGIEISKNGGTPQGAIITTSWTRDDFANGRRRFTLYAMHVPVATAVGTPGPGFVEDTHPRLAGSPVVIGEATLEVSNLEVAKLLLAGLNEMLSKQPPEILQVKAG